MFGGRPLMIHSCWRPSSGESLFLGSHSKQLAIKFTKLGSGVSLNLFIMYVSLSSFYSWVRTSSGAGTALSLNYEKRPFLVDLSRTDLEGIPITSIISYSYSFSLVPGNRGKPV